MCKIEISGALEQRWSTPNSWDEGEGKGGEEK